MDKESSPKLISKSCMRSKIFLNCSFGICKKCSKFLPSARMQLRNLSNIPVVVEICGSKRILDTVAKFWFSFSITFS